MLLRGVSDLEEWLEMSVMQHINDREDYSCGTKRVLCRELYSSLYSRADDAVVCWNVSSQKPDGSLKPPFTSVQVIND